MLQFLQRQARQVLQVLSCKGAAEFLHAGTILFPLLDSRSRRQLSLLVHQICADLGQHGMDIAQLIGFFKGLYIRLGETL